RVLYPRQEKRGTCLPRAYATYHALRRYGHPAIFVSGVTRTPKGVTGHAWVEDDRGIMETYGEPLVRLRFTETFRVPGQPNPGQNRPDGH
ncbi:lasso peptide biosynthesis B2 protein, partial [Deinococcus taklimakanensis]